MATRPLEQVLDEVEQSSVRPVQVLEDQHDRPLLGEALEEEPPGREEVLPVGGGSLGQAEQVREPRLEPGPLLLVGDVLLDRGAELCERGLGRLLLEDPRPHAHHLGERPVRHTLAVGKTTAAVPPEEVGEPVDVLLELPGEARLPETRRADDRDELRLALFRRAVEDLLDEAQLPVAPLERRLEADRLLRAAAGSEHAERAVQRQRFRLALQLVLTCRFVGDRGLGRAAGRLADQHRPGLSGGLDPRGGVDQVAGDHPLAFGADRHGRLAGEHARPRRESRIELLHCGEQVERRPDRPLGVVLVRGRRPPHRHHGVADELLDGAAVQGDQPAAGLEVAGQQLTGVLRVPALGCGGEADEVGEEDGDHLPLGGRGSSRRRRGLRAQRGATFAAELDPGRVRRAAGRADESERASALATELSPGIVLGTAGWARHRTGKRRSFRPVTEATRASRRRRRARRPSRSRTPRTGGSPGCRARR